MPKFRWARWVPLILLTGCATTLPERRVDEVGARRTESAQITAAGPVVVFENGFAANLGSWGKVFPVIGQTYTVFAYNRPGYGASAGAETPRDGATIVNELRALLRARGLQPPYILVGHSLGGIYVQYFARTYPEEVAGLVLVDSSHPSQFADGPAAVKNWPWWARAWKLFLSDSQKNELAAAPETGEALLRLTPAAHMPVVVLSAKSDADTEAARYFREQQTDLARLYPGSRHVWVESGHFIQHDQPEVVIEAIREVAAKATPVTPVRSNQVN